MSQGKYTYCLFSCREVKGGEEEVVRNEKVSPYLRLKQSLQQGNSPKVLYFTYRTNAYRGYRSDPLKETLWGRTRQVSRRGVKARQ